MIDLSQFPFITKVIIPEANIYTIQGKTISQIFYENLSPDYFSEDERLGFKLIGTYPEEITIIDNLTTKERKIVHSSNSELRAEYKKSKLSWNRMTPGIQLLATEYSSIAVDHHLKPEVTEILRILENEYRSDSFSNDRKLELSNRIDQVYWKIAKGMLYEK